MTSNFSRSVPFQPRLWRAVVCIAIAGTLLLGGCKLDSNLDPPDTPISEERDGDSGWTQSVDAGDHEDSVVWYRARLEGDYLVIEATHHEGWHTYAMDNELRSKEKLAGEMAVGVEVPTSFSVQGATVVGPWFQSPPKDLSDKEISWYTWGFPGTALFASKLKGVKAKVLVIEIRGQCCNAETCCDVDLELRLDSTTNRTAVAVDLDKLIRVRESAQ